MKVNVDMATPDGLTGWAQDLTAMPSPPGVSLAVAVAQYNPISPFTPSGLDFTNLGSNLLQDWSGVAFSPVPAGTYDLLSFILKINTVPGSTGVANILSPIGNFGWSGTTPFNLYIANNAPTFIMGQEEQFPAITVRIIPEPTTGLLVLPLLLAYFRRVRACR